VGWKGGCQCGAVRYEIEGPLPPVYACHCRECRRQSSSAFALSMPVERAALRLAGALEAYVRPTDSGTCTLCHFCPACGTRVYHQSERSPEGVTIKAGTLDDAEGLSPVAHLWVSRKQPWVALDQAVPSFDTQSDDLRAWRAALSAGAR
jgi:hypothetical protein